MDTLPTHIPEMIERLIFQVTLERAKLVSLKLGGRIMAKDTGFYRREHDVSNYTGTHRPAVSQWAYENAVSASAMLTNGSGTAYLQSDGRPPIVIGRIPDLIGFIGRSGVSGLSEQSNIWCIAGCPQHIFLYGETEYSALLPKLTPITSGI
jgi:hypothetical protein